MNRNNHAPSRAGVDKLAVEFTFSPRNSRARSSPGNPGPNPGPERGCALGPASSPSLAPGAIPSVTRLMALAIKFDGMIQNGEVKDFADLARLGYVSRARITQIMNLISLAPDIQEEILSLPRTTTGRDPIREQNLRPVAGVLCWSRQRKMWAALKIKRT